MYANLIGIPAAFVIFLATDHYLGEWDLVGDRLAIDALGVCLGLCVYFMARGLDIFLDQKRDNPEPFLAPKAVPEAFGTIKELLSESSYGPFFWSLKTVDAEASKMVAVMNFTELMGSGFIVPPLQARRLMMVQILVDPVPDADQKPLYPTLTPPPAETESETLTSLATEKGITTIQLQWMIDSPLNRVTVNKIQDKATKSIKKSLGLPVPEDPKPSSPFEPPFWLLILTVMAGLYCMQRAEQYGDFKTKREEQQKTYQLQMQRDQAAQEESARKAQEAQTARDAYYKGLEQQSRQAKEEQRRKAEELNRQQQNQFTPPYSTPFAPSNKPFTTTPDQGGGLSKPFSTPYTTPITPAPTDQESKDTKPWRSRFGGN